MEKLKTYLSEFNKPRILDIATGVGSFIGLLIHLYDDYSEIIGIDHSPKAVEAAGKNFEDQRISFQKMDADSMSFEKHSFDIVCLSNSLHHMADMSSTINKMIEMVRPDGILLFNEMISDNEDEKQMTHTYYHHFWAEVNRASGVVHNETMTKQEITDLFTEHPDIEIKATWEMQVPGAGEVPQEAYGQIKNTLSKSLEAVKDHSDYDRFAARAKELEELLDKVGFASASQILTIVKPKP